MQSREGSLQHLISVFSVDSKNLLEVEIASKARWYQQPNNESITPNRQVFSADKHNCKRNNDVLKIW